MGGVDLYHVATGRSVWFDQLEALVQEAPPIRALKKREHRKDPAQNLQTGILASKGSQVYLLAW